MQRIKEKINWSIRLAKLGSSFFSSLHLFFLSFRIPLFNRLHIGPKPFKISIKKYGRTATLYGTGRYEELLLLTEIFLDEEYKIPENLSPVSTIIDCGANIGYTSVYYALSHKDAKIYAYEPDPETFKILQKNSEHLPIVCKNEALSDTKGETSFYLHPKKHISSSLFKRDSSYIEKKVKTVTLKDVLDVCGGNADVFKFDIEGGEFRIFHPEEKQISHIRYITGELHPDIAKKDIQQITHLLEITHTVTLVPVAHLGRYICHALRKENS